MMTTKSGANQRSDATVRALARVKAGEKPSLAAKAEGIAPSTIWRALAKDRPRRQFLTMARERGGINVWLEDDRQNQIGGDVQFDDVASLVDGLPKLLARLQ